MTKNFTTPEILNIYRHTDKNVDKKIKEKDMIEEKYKNLDKIINKNINKIKESKSTNNFTTNYNFTNDDDDSISDKNGYKYNIDISDKYKQEYRFNNDENLLDSFSKVYGKNNIKYEPRDNTRFIRVKYLLKKSKKMKI